MEDAFSQFLSSESSPFNANLHIPESFENSCSESSEDSVSYGDNDYEECFDAPLNLQKFKSLQARKLSKIIVNLNAEDLNEIQAAYIKRLTQKKTNSSKSLMSGAKDLISEEEEKLPPASDAKI